MRSQYKLRFDCKQTNPRQSNRVNTGVFCFKSILWEFRWLMFLFLLAIPNWLNFQPCNRKKERRVKIFLGEVAVVVVPQSIRRLSLQKSQALAIETRFYLFQNCHIFFFSMRRTSVKPLPGTLMVGLMIQQSVPSSFSGLGSLFCADFLTFPGTS